MTTRDTILREALDLFSVKGYDAVSVRDIAQAVGIRQSSLYNHFGSKQEIFDCLLEEYTDRWESIFRQLGLAEQGKPMAVDVETVGMYRHMTAQAFRMLAGTLFDAYMTDEINVKMRRMLTLEQYRDERIGKLFRKVSFDDSLAFQAGLFEALMEQGCFVRTDPYMLALAFFAPIFLIFYKYGNSPEEVREAKEMFLRHMDHFNQIYAIQ